MTQHDATGLHPIGRRVAGVLLGAAALLAATVLPVAAAPAPAAVSIAPSATVPTMIVLDASGSMLADDAPGLRIDAAKNAVTELIDSLPTGAEVGLQVYGTGTGSSEAEKVAGCQDVVTVAPVAQHDPAALKAAVAGIQARGYTPIGTALRAAAAALPLEGPRSIVLVSDGEDTCAPPAACDVAQELDLAGTDLVVHSVGFKVDQTVRDELSCIADATGGSYADAGDAVTLAEVLTVTVDRALTGYTATGQPVTGADQQTPDAPTLQPGQYVDTFPVGKTDSAPGTVRYYRVPTPAGGRVHVSATFVHPDQPDDGWNAVSGELSLVDLDGKNCVSRSGMSTPFTIDPRFTTVTAALTIDGEKDCTDRDELHLRLERTGDAWAAVPMAVELTVRIEPPATEPGPAVPQDSPDLPKPVYTPAVPATGGRSFNDATLLRAGQTISDTVREGEVKFYRVPVAWGQRLQYLLREVGPVQGNVFVGNNIEVTVFNPVREEVTAARGATMMFNAKGNEILGATGHPVAYLQRENNNSALSLDGDFYLVVTGSRHAGDEPAATTTVEFTAVLAGPAETGPTYGDLGTLPTSSVVSTTTPGTSAADWIPVSSSTAPSSVEPSTTAPRTPATTSADVAGAAVSGTSATTPGGGALWWVVGAVLLAAAAGGAVVALRRRTPADH